MRQRDPIVFVPCEDKGCHYFREYRMRFDQKGQPYGIGMDGPADALHLCHFCKRSTKKDFYYNSAEEAKKEAEEGKK
jgi:hypothetical protein